MGKLKGFMEMNLHYPQSVHTMGELRDLAAIPYMILSAKSATPIIEVVQDTLVGTFRLTKQNVTIDDKTMANLQMVNSYFTGNLEHKTSYTGQEAFSAILPRGLYTICNNKQDQKVIIHNSVIDPKSGPIDQNIFHAMSAGLTASIYHDYGPFEVKKFLDNTQRLICRWLLNDGFSVGISDLMISEEAQTKLKRVIKEMKESAFKKLEDVRRGNLDNNSILNNEEYVERDIINILNKTNGEVFKIGLSEIDDTKNRMTNMIKSGSKGKDNNLVQMIGTVGQQNVDGKRISYGFTGRTLPHYTKYDDGPEARGFVENSFINGLTPQEVFFHAMGGREGLIDTAVKSVTGDTPIIIIEDGVSKYVKIGEWVDNHMKNNPEGIEQFGPEDMNMEMLGLPEGAYIPTSDKKGNVTWGKMTNVSRHDPGEKLYKVTTLGGRKIIVTASKSLIVWNEKKQEFIKTKTEDIKINDILPTTFNLSSPPLVSKYVDMSNYFDKKTYIYSRDLFYIKERLNTITDKWYTDNNGILFTLPYPNLTSVKRTIKTSKKINELKENCIYSYSATKITTHIPDKFELNEENGIFIGLFLADGNARIKPGEVCITKHEKNVRSFVQKYYDKFGINHHERIKKSETSESIMNIGNTVQFAEFLLSFVGHTAQNKYVPTEAYTAPIEFIKGLINGYISGDGWVDRTTNGIICQSTSKTMINGINHLLSRLGIFAKASKILPKGKQKSKVYKLSIRAKYVCIFKKQITLINTEKQNTLDAIKVKNQEHLNFSSHNNIILDKVSGIKLISEDKIADKYKKAYDVTVPETGFFSVANGLTVTNTSDTGYVQRRLVKSMEDTKIYYDQTVRNAAGTIIQYIYGEDGIDATKIENQYVPTIDMDITTLAKEYLLTGADFLEVHMNKKAADATKSVIHKCEELYKQMLDDREFMINKVFNGDNVSKIKYPISFSRIIKKAIESVKTAKIKRIPKTDLDAKYIIETIEKLIDTLHFKGPEQSMRFLHMLLRINLNPKQLIIVHHMTKSMFDWVVETIITRFKESVAQSGEMVGIIAAQTIGEMGTQMTLNSFHVSGTAAAVQATSGVPRLKEILSVSKNIKTPTMTIYLKEDGARVVNLQENDTTQSLENAKLLAMEVKNSLEITKLSDILISSAIYWDNRGSYDTLIEEDKGLLELYRMFETVNEASCNTSVDNNWVIRMKFDKFKMASFGLRMIDIHTKLNMNYNDQIECIYSDDNAEISVARIKLRDVAMKNLDSNDNIVAALKAMEDNLVNNVLLKGVKGIKKVSLNKEINTKYNSSTMQFDKITEWVLDTDGTNMQDILIHPDIDNIRTRSNDIREIYEILGIEAARKALSIELTKVIGDKMNYRHMTLLLDTITNKGALMSIDRHGINRGDVGPLAKSSFEETTDMLVKACTFSEFDKINGVSANIMLGQCPLAGTGDTKIMLDESYMIQLMTEQNKIDFVVDGEFNTIEEEDEGCDDIAFEFTLPSKK